jgi:predicted XRE-type DNA-binding protein
MIKTIQSVWDATELTPLEAANMRAKSTLLMALQNWLAQSEEAQKALAQSLGVTQPRLSDLKRGHIDLFSLDTLLNMADQAGLEPSIKVRALPKPKPTPAPFFTGKNAEHLAKSIAQHKAGLAKRRKLKVV